MIEEFEKILYEFEASPIVKKYRLTREEFLYLHFFAEGKIDYEIEDYLNRRKSYLYNLRKQLITKFHANSFEQVMYLYGTFNRSS